MVRRKAQLRKSGRRNLAKWNEEDISAEGRLAGRHRNPRGSHNPAELGYFGYGYRPGVSATDGHCSGAGNPRNRELAGAIAAAWHGDVGSGDGIWRDSQSTHAGKPANDSE